MTKLPRDEQITDATCVTCGFPFDTDEPCRALSDHGEPVCGIRCAQEAERAHHAFELRAWCD